MFIYVASDVSKSSLRHRYMEIKAQQGNVLLRTHYGTHTPSHSSNAVEWNNGQGDGIVGRFYHSHSLNHQPSAKSVHSCLLAVYTCV